jgi:bacteriorhodopsin
MRTRLIYLVSGYLSIAVGICAALSIYRMKWMMYGIALAIFGFIFAIINIFLNAKYFSDGEDYPKGYLGMFLSSLPVIFMLLIIFKFRR